MSEKHVKNPFSIRQQNSSGFTCANSGSCLTRHTTHVAWLCFSNTSLQMSPIGYILYFWKCCSKSNQETLVFFSAVKLFANYFIIVEFIGSLFWKDPLHGICNHVCEVFDLAVERGKWRKDRVMVTCTTGRFTNY